MRFSTNGSTRRTSRGCGFVENSPKPRNEAGMEGERNRAGFVKGKDALWKDGAPRKCTGIPREDAVDKCHNHMGLKLYAVHRPI
jgi:hypothetical protein